VCALLEGSGASVAICDVSQAKADAVTVDALARLQLAVGRTGCRMSLRCVSPELSVLIELVGLEEVLGD
jgi:anti-anti-sigma regulatory factor